MIHQCDAGNKRDQGPHHRQEAREDQSLVAIALIKKVGLLIVVPVEPGKAVKDGWPQPFSQFIRYPVAGHACCEENDQRHPNMYCAVGCQYAGSKQQTITWQKEGGWKKGGFAENNGKENCIGDEWVQRCYLL